jgi:phosphoglycolate phosphatase
MTAALGAIFDFDGTIADSLGEVLAVYNTLAKDLNTPTVSHEELEQLRRLGPREVMRELRVPYWKLPSVMKTVRSAMRERMAHLRPFEGMTETLHELWRRGVKTAIVSSNSQENVSEFLARHGIDRFEALSCGVGLFGKAKRLRRIAERSEFAGAKLYYVGDEVRDVTAAAEAGMSSVAVTWGHGERSALEAESPYHLVNAPSDLVSIFAL